jgi:hypothetical protein
MQIVLHPRQNASEGVDRAVGDNRPPGGMARNRASIRRTGPCAEARRRDSDEAAVSRRPGRSRTRPYARPSMPRSPTSDSSAARRGHSGSLGESELNEADCVGALRRRPTISESTRPLGSTRHCIPSEAKPSAVPPPPARRFGGASSADAANPRDRFSTTGFGNTSADPLVDRGMASLARTGARGNGNARSPSPQVASLVFGRRPSRK